MEKFIKHLHEENSRFICEPAGKSQDARKEFQIDHLIGRVSTENQLKRLKEMSGNEFKSLKKFYSRMNGGLFYVNKKESGISIPPINSLLKLNKEMRSWIFDESESPVFQRKGFAFGEIVASGNYFIIYKEKIYYSDHDGGNNKPIANNIDKFFDKIAKDPAKFLLECGCYTRYFHGKSKIQWIPEKYISG